MSKYVTVQLKDLDQFLYILRGGDNDPHEVLKIMIDHNQELGMVRNYFKAMINDIDKLDKTTKQGESNGKRKNN